MRITDAALSYISLPSSKGDPFRERLSQKKEKKMSRLINRAFSAPIRRMGRQLLENSSKRLSSRKEKRRKASDQEERHDEEQGWIATATTFETEDSLSPKSFDSWTIGDSPSILVQTVEKSDEVSNVGSSQQAHSNESWDWEAASNESAEINMVFRSETKVENYDNKTEYNVKVQENDDEENAAPQIGIDAKEYSHGNKKEDENEGRIIQKADDNSISQGDVLTVEPEYVRDSMVSLLSKIDTTEIIDEDNEIGSLVPVADISFFLDEEGCEDSLCAGRISTEHNERPPVEIDVDGDSLDDVVVDYRSQDSDQVLYFDGDDDVSSTSSYNSYLQAIESITSSANSRVEQAVSTLMNKMERNTTHSYTKSQVRAIEEPEFDDEEDCISVSFNPSKSLLLSAMKGASEKARIDIEKATALALSKIDCVDSALPKKGKSHSSLAAINCVFGLLFLFLFLNLNGNSLRFLTGTNMAAYEEGLQRFQIQTLDDTEGNPQSHLSAWEDEQMVVKANNSTQIYLRNDEIYNVGCAFKIRCLALGAI
mmetsp:Transcript_6014/g.14911  ORF Transcript_6014/g.14911 Transcript_6014/m.14911 type:complete len:539 (-) Transcript_6014:312-1928(-)|eukprot:CAMPEP_0197175346 /NCGR_PEP_ID=MMETSP1423-20130617/1588_1 /TAXON_ID=476441 /ORGANISM="Pseudo-nitzschia heimii, Strain UNC1101" /LENGTH=538 /DNA_ID=CAMNT_0042624475 /DNA_START=125 /DNA_END=1741 /DNA_ORIENTATION=-